VKQGTLIGNDGDARICAPFDGVVIFPHNCEDVNKEAFIMGKEE